MNLPDFKPLIQALERAVPLLNAHCQAHPITPDPVVEPDEALLANPLAGIDSISALTDAERFAEAEVRQRTLVYVLGLAAKIKPAYQVFFVLATRNHGRILHLADRDDAALPVELEATRMLFDLVLATTEAGDHPTSPASLLPLPTQLAELADVTSHLGAHLQRIGQSAAAVDVLGRVVGLQQHWSKKQPGMWSYLDGSLVRYADALEQAGKHSEAVDVIKGHLMERRLRDPGASQAPLLVRLSRLSHALGRYEEALRAADQAAEDDPQLESARWRQIDALGALADEATRKRQLRRALDYLERQMEVCRLAGESNPEAQQLYEDCQPELVALKAEVARMARRG